MDVYSEVSFSKHDSIRHLPIFDQLHFCMDDYSSGVQKVTESVGNSASGFVEVSVLVWHGVGLVDTGDKVISNPTPSVMSGFELLLLQNVACYSHIPVVYIRKKKVSVLRSIWLVW